MVDTGKELSTVITSHALDNVTTEQIGDVLSQKEIELAYAEERKLIAAKQQYVNVSFAIAAHLKTILDNRWYKVLGHSTFESWCESPEIDLDRSTAFRYVRMFNVYLASAAFTMDELQDVGISKLDLMVHYVKPDEPEWDTKKKELLQMFTLPRRELTKFLNEDTSSTPILPTTKTSNASYEVVSEHPTDSTGPSQKGKEADDAFSTAHKSEKSSGSQIAPVVQPIDSKRLGISGWYELVPLEQEPTAKGKLVTGAMLSANKILVTGSKIFIDIE